MQKIYFLVKVNIFCLKTEILKHEVLGYVPAEHFLIKKKEVKNGPSTLVSIRGCYLF